MCVGSENDKHLPAVIMELGFRNIAIQQKRQRQQYNRKMYLVNWCPLCRLEM